MEMLIADWVLAAVALTAAVTGLFRGFSGTLAFSVASACASIAGLLAWNAACARLEAVWQCGAIALVAALIAFGISRIIVKKIVHGLLAQPTDSLLGFLIGAALGIAPIVIWAKLGVYLEYSNLARGLQQYVG